MIQVEFQSLKEYEDMTMMALRYALPRHTYVTDEVSTHITNNLSTFSDQFISQAKDEVCQHLHNEMRFARERGTVPWTIDYNTWSLLYETLKTECSNRLERGL